MNLTEEQLAKIDAIIEDTDVQYDYHWNGETSLNEPSVYSTLSLAARRVREYLRSLEE